MKKEVLFLILDHFADWEGAFLASGFNTGFSPTGNGHTDYVPKWLSPVKAHVRSLGGMTVAVDYTAATMPKDFAALILVGGTSWKTAEAEQVVPIVEKALAHGALVGAICSASCFMGAHGFLNNVRHTSNTLDLLKTWGGRYTGEALYQERQAVRDGNIVTANGSGCLEFSRECLLGLQAGTPEEIEGWYAFNKHGLYEQ